MKREKLITEWFKYPETKPPKWGKYLVYAESADPESPFYFISFYEENQPWPWSSLLEVVSGFITHWAYLPICPGGLNIYESDKNKKHKTNKGDGQELINAALKLVEGSSDHNK
jgi:hypothetical protein